jgi:hypothetical protein
MRASGRFLVAACAAALLFAGAREVQAAAAPVVDAVYSVTPAREGMMGESPPTIVTVIGKNLTRFTAFSLVEMGQPVDLLVRSKKMLVLRLPPGLANGSHGVKADIGSSSSVTLYATVNDPGAQGVLNSMDNPLDWSQLKGVPAGFADGTDGDAWSTGSGNAYRSTGRVGVDTAAPSASLHVAGADGVLFEGISGMGSIPATGTGMRLMWYGKRAALRAGHVSGTQWDDASIGDFSVAFGDDTKAMGQDAAAFGGVTIASGTASTAMGFGTTASGTASASMGDNTSASGYSSLATGHYTSSTGDYSVVFGEYNTAQAYDSVVLGRYGVVAGSTGTWVATDPLLVAGNGTVISPSNALTLLKNGNLTIAGTLTQNSDARLKTDVAPLAGVLPRLAGIRGVSYRMKEGESGPQIGLLAQEVRAAFPELVREDARGTLSVAYGNFSAVLLQAIQEQQAELEARDRTIAGLEERLARLEALVEAGLKK